MDTRGWFWVSFSDVCILDDSILMTRIFFYLFPNFLINRFFRSNILLYFNLSTSDFMKKPILVFKNKYHLTG